MVDNRTNFAKEIAALLRETYGSKIKVFGTEIPHSVRAKEISAEGKSIFAHDPGGKVAEAYRSAYERFSTCYRTLHHIVKGRDWQDYPPEEIADAFEDINDHPFDGMPGVFYEV